MTILSRAFNSLQQIILGWKAARIARRVKYLRRGVKYEFLMMDIKEFRAGKVSRVESFYRRQAFYNKVDSMTDDEIFELSKN